MKFLTPVFCCFCILGVAGSGLVNPNPGWVEEALQRHNQYRKGFDAPLLKLNETLCVSSLAYARELAERDDQEALEHSGLGYGENIYMTKGVEVEVYGSTPVDRWYDEIDNYFRRNEDDENEDLDEAAVGSFTQLVWKSTTDMCISYAASEPDEDEGTGTLYVVAHYYPPGNTDEDDEDDNVTPLLSSPYYYKNSESAPKRRHLSEPIGIDGEFINEHPERSCWEDWANFDKDTEVTTPEEFIEEALNVTNDFRLRHHIPPMPPLDGDCMLCKSAQGLADALVGNTSLGDWKNAVACGQLLYNSPKLLTAKDVIHVWYSEGQTYEFDHHRTSTGIYAGNFVRLIWKGTEQFCVAYAKKNGVEEYVYVGVVYEDPKQNYDQFEARMANVFSSVPALTFNVFAIYVGTLISIYIF